MRKTFLCTLALIFISFWIPAKQLFSQNNKDAETVIHLLGYISRDYPEGVRDGKVVNAQEYEEMKEFSAQVLKLSREGNFLKDKKDEKILEIEELIDHINNLGTGDKINLLATKIKDEVIAISGVTTAPRSWPDIAKGQTLYQTNCAVCHGDKGNGSGVGAAGLDPLPTNFTDLDLMRQVSPYQAFNTIKLGVEGTSMRAFGELNEQEMWDLAFYIKSFPYRGASADSTQMKNELKAALSFVDLRDIATLSDIDLAGKLKASGGNSDMELKALRTVTPGEEEMPNSLVTAREALNKALSDYENGDKKSARSNALSAYLEGVEPVEASLRAKDKNFVLKLEQQMMNVRQAIEKDHGTDIVKEEIDKAMVMINEADDLMKGHQLNYWLTFILAASIMLREGLEAFLIIAIVLALIRSSGSKKALGWLHGGWIAAVLLGIAGWFLSDYIIKFGGRNRETMEGAISLLAVGILVSMGLWLHSKTEAKKWTDFIKNRIGSYLDRDHMWGLAGFAFVVVFREAFEVILFLKAVSLEASHGNQSAIGFGSLAAVAAIVVMVYLFLKYSTRLPIRQLFRYSSWFIVLLAVILMGKGIHALQESGIISVTGWSSWPTIDWLGIYPSMQTILAQFTIMLIVLGTFWYRGKVQKQVVKNV